MPGCLLHLVSPDDYARAVRGYCCVKTGAGQDHTALAELLANNGQATTNNALQAQLPDGFVIRTSSGPGRGPRTLHQQCLRTHPALPLRRRLSILVPRTSRRTRQTRDGTSPSRQLRFTTPPTSSPATPSGAAPRRAPCLRPISSFREATCRRGSRTLGRGTWSTPSSFAATWTSDGATRRPIPSQPRPFHPRRGISSSCLSCPLAHGQCPRKPRGCRRIE